MLDEAEGLRAWPGPAAGAPRRPVRPRPARLRERATTVPDHEADTKVEPSASVVSSPCEQAASRLADSVPKTSNPQVPAPLVPASQVRVPTGTGAKPLSRVARRRAARAAATQGQAKPLGSPGQAADAGAPATSSEARPEPDSHPKPVKAETTSGAASGALLSEALYDTADVDKAASEPADTKPVEDIKEAGKEGHQQPQRVRAKASRTRREAVRPRARPHNRSDRLRPASAGGARAVAIDSRRSTARRQLLSLGGMMLLVVLWLAAAVLTSSTVSARTRCSGIPIGGMSHAEAAAAIEVAYADKAAGPLLVSADGATVQIDGAAVNATVDGEASIAGLTRYSLNPMTIARRLVGGQEVEAVVTADPQAVREQLSAHLPQLSHGAVSASVSIVDGEVQRSAASNGTGVDIDAASQMLSSRWPAGSTTVVALPEGAAEPVVTDEEAKEFATNVVEPLLAGDITLTVAGTEAEERATAQEMTLSAADVLSLASISDESGALTVTLEPTRLRELVLEGFGTGIETSPTGFTWSIDGSQEGAASAEPELVPATPGKAVDGAVLSNAIVEAVSNSGASAESREVPLVLSASGEAAPGSEAEAQAMGITEVVGEYSTPFDSDPDRDQNLRTGAAAVNGALVLPGQSYSMVDTIGPVEPGRGYTEAGVIVGANHVNGLGGGLSQVTTTVFNAAFEAGMEDDEHTPHSQYMSRYPEGREATMWRGQIDMRFTNSTPYALLLQAWVADGQVHVRVWSTHYYDVSITTGERFNVVPQQTLTSSAEGCLPNPEGQPGFDVTVTRQRSLNGQALPAEVRTVHYEPNDTVVCG